MLERQIMFKQLQELQRQKKVQELNDSRQQNVMESLLHNKQSSGALYGLVNTGIPVRDPSQMFMFGDTNFVQGLSNRLVSSQAQNQVLQSVGQYSQFQGQSHESSGLFGPVFSRGLGLVGQTGKVQQVNSHDRHASPQEFGGVREGGTENVSGNQDLPTLDPLEQKILFNMGASCSKHGSMDMESSENMVENKDNSSDLPSLQSRSWSALMQSAVAEATSSSDAGVQEEWSGLSFQNPEPSNENQPSSLVESGKHPTSWLYNNSPKPELLNTSNAGSSFHGQGFLPEEATFRRGDYSVMPGFMDRSAGFPAPNSTAQASHNMLELLHKVDKEYSHGTQSGYTGSAPITKVPKAEPENGFTPSYNNSSRSPYFGLRLAPPSQRPLVNYFDQSRLSQQASHPDKPFQGPQYDNNQLQNQIYMANQSPLLSVKNEDSQQASTFGAKQRPATSKMAQQVASSTWPPNIWVDVPVRQNPSAMGSCEPPSASYATNSRMETAFEASKGLDCWKHVKGGNNFVETDAHVINSQGLEDGRGFASKIYLGNESLSGNPEANCVNHPLPISRGDLEAFGHSLKETDAPPRSQSLLKRMNYDPKTRTALKNESVIYDGRVPQATSLAQPNSAFGNHTSHPISSQPLQDISQDIVTHNNAPSWLKNHEASKTEQMLPMNDARIRNNEASLMAGGSPGNLESSSLVQVASNDQYRSSGPITVNNIAALTCSSSIYLQHLDMANQNMVVLKSKKRKFPTFESLPWHKEVTGDCSSLHDMSTAELEWARSANRLPEKLKEEAEVHRKRRLILTTQLMQLIFLPAPAVILTEDVTAHCDTVTYYAAKLALGDACSLASHSYTRHAPLGKFMNSKNSSDQDLLKTVESFIGRSKRLEEELSRLEKGESSILDVKVEFQDLEKISFINRFAKFHSRGPLITPDTASSGGASTMPKLYPERYVKASAMPSTVPEGHHCLSL